MESKLAKVARFLMGIILLVFGLNKFLQFMPMPAMPEEAGAFMGALAKTGYMFPLIAIVEVVVGILLVLKRKVSLALLLMAPVTVNIILFHLFLDPAGIAAGALVAILHVYLLFANKSAYQQII